MGAASLNVNDLVAEHPSTTINNLKIDAGFSGTIDSSTIMTGTISHNIVVEPTFAMNVVEFNQKVLKIEPRPISTLAESEYDISVKCLNEEITEFQEAYEQGDIIGMIDALTDLKYFADGVLYKMGLTAQSIDKIGAAVHAANMEKKLGVNARRGDGTAADAVKPAGWVAPEERIGLILDEQEANK